MEETAIDKLVDTIFYGGFKDIITKDELIENIKEGLPEFSKEFSVAYGNDQVPGKMNFQRSEKGDYFFNNFDLTLNKENGESVSRNFKNNYGNSYTLKEAYNMLDGRSVFKEFLPMQKKDEVTGKPLPFERDESGKLKTYTAWSYLDRSEKDTNGNFLIKKTFNFDLEKALSKENIQEMDFQQSKSNLVNSLERGNLQIVNYKTDGEEFDKKYISANPRFGGINRFDEHLNPERLKEHSNVAVTNQNQDLSQDNKNEKSQKEDSNNVGKKQKNESSDKKKGPKVGR